MFKWDFKLNNINYTGMQQINQTFIFNIKFVLTK